MTIKIEAVSRLLDMHTSLNVTRAAQIANNLNPEMPSFVFNAAWKAFSNKYLRIQEITASTVHSSEMEELWAGFLAKAERATGIGAGALIYALDTNKYLYLLRSEICDEPNTWCCPGGGVEKGETIEEGLKRELQEEIGYAGELALHHCFKSEQPDFVYHNHIGIVPNQFEPKLNNEHSEYSWYPPGSYPEPMHPKFQEALSSKMSRLIMRREAGG